MRRCFAPQSLDKLIKKSSLSEIHHHYKLLSSLESYIKDYFPSAFSDSIQVANYKQNVLTIYVANAAILMRVKYQQSDLMSALRKDKLPGLSSIIFKVNPLTEIRKRPPTL